MSLTKPARIPPGISKLDSNYASQGRWVDGDKIRFVAGRPEKIGGWAKMLSQAFSGISRKVLAWTDNGAVTRLAIGTHTKLYYLFDGVYTNITPLRPLTTGTLGATPVATTSGSSIVTITHASHGQAVDDWVELTASAAINGVTLAGNYQILTVPGANSYTIDTGQTATGTSSGGGTVTYSYERATLSNPFATTASSTTVTVTHTSHGATDGDTVIIAGASAVGGITPDGSYTITYVDANTYTITHSAAASGTASGGGSPTVCYEINVGLSTSDVANGWGTGAYGYGTYGTSNGAGILTPARTWSLDVRGQNLIASPRRGKIYEYNPDLAGRAYHVYGSPSVNEAVLVTDQRHVFSIGSGTNKNRVAWPDADDDTDWTPVDTNTANIRDLQTGSLHAGVQIRNGLILIFNSLNVYAFQYTGDDFVYRSDRLGAGNGLIGPNAIAQIGGTVFWMGLKNFWMFDGGGVRPMPAVEDIRKHVFDDITNNQRDKFFAVENKQYNEIWFFYVSNGATEIDSYVIFHINENCWSIGTLVRTAGLDAGDFQYSIYADASSYLYYHENGVDDGTSAMDSYVTTAPFDIENGDKDMEIMGIIPDFKRQVGNVSITVNTRRYPNESDTTNGPFTATTTTGRIDPTARPEGKMAGFKVESNVLAGDFRLGDIRFDVQPSGTRQ